MKYCSTVICISLVLNAQSAILHDNSKRQLRVALAALQEEEELVLAVRRRVAFELILKMVGDADRDRVDAGRTCFDSHRLRARARLRQRPFGRIRRL